MNPVRTPLDDADHKTDLIEHINEDPAEEVRAIARAYGSDPVAHAVLRDLFK